MLQRNQIDKTPLAACDEMSYHAASAAYLPLDHLLSVPCDVSLKTTALLNTKDILHILAASKSHHVNFVMHLEQNLMQCPDLLMAFLIFRLANPSLAKIHHNPLFFAYLRHQSTHPHIALAYIIQLTLSNKDVHPQTLFHLMHEWIYQSHVPGSALAGEVYYSFVSLKMAEWTNNSIYIEAKKYFLSGLKQLFIKGVSGDIAGVVVDALLSVITLYSETNKATLYAELFKILFDATFDCFLEPTRTSLHISNSMKLAAKHFGERITIEQALNKWHSWNGCDKTASYYFFESQLEVANPQQRHHILQILKSHFLQKVAIDPELAYPKTDFLNNEVMLRGIYSGELKLLMHYFSELQLAEVTSLLAGLDQLMSYPYTEDNAYFRLMDVAEMNGTGIEVDKGITPLDDIKNILEYLATTLAQLLVMHPNGSPLITLIQARSTISTSLAFQHEYLRNSQKLITDLFQCGMLALNDFRLLTVQREQDERMDAEDDHAALLPIHMGGILVTPADERVLTTLLSAIGKTRADFPTTAFSLPPTDLFRFLNICDKNTLFEYLKCVLPAYEDKIILSKTWIHALIIHISTELDLNEARELLEPELNASLRPILIKNTLEVFARSHSELKPQDEINLFDDLKAYHPSCWHDYSKLESCIEKFEKKSYVDTLSKEWTGLMQSLNAHAIRLTARHHNAHIRILRYLTPSSLQKINKASRSNHLSSLATLIVNQYDGAVTQVVRDQPQENRPSALTTVSRTVGPHSFFGSAAAASTLEQVKSQHLLSPKPM
jgi:hypothetical protein